MLWLILPLVLVIGLVRALESRMAFYPMSGEPTRVDALGVPAQAHTIPTADGEHLRLWHLQPSDSRAQIVYFHGNGGHLSLWADVFVELARRGFEVIAIDYRGYGVSTGTPSETGLYRDVDATLEFVHARLRKPPAPLIYWGRSLGATMAAYAASRRAPDGVVLEAGFPDVRSVLRSSPLLWLLSWASSYRFPTARWMRSVDAPVLVLHGDSDTVIPYALGRQLFEALPGPKRFVTIRGGDHNDPAPVEPGAYWTPIDDFVESLHHGSSRSGG